MSNVILPVFILVGIILCIFCTRSQNKIKINMLAFTLGLAALFISFFAFEFTQSMKLDISRREMIQISSENIFVVETNHCKPMIIETATVYNYPLSGFEKWWLGERYITNLEEETTCFYEIYVPEGTFSYEYNLK